MRRNAALGLLCLIGCLTGCEAKEKTFDPPDRDAQIVEADELFAEVRFDTIAWDSEQARARAGNEVYAARCRNCHGTLGSGAAEYASARGIDVPSLVEAEWAFADQPDSVRHRIFVGHAAGMPTWGVAGISEREIDAVAFYVLERLRPEMLEER